MSSNNQLVISKLGNKFSVSDVDIEGGGGFFISDNHFDTLGKAIRAANKYMEQRMVEYGLKINI